MFAVIGAQSVEFAPFEGGADIGSFCAAAELVYRPKIKLVAFIVAIYCALYDIAVGFYS
jgi:hypothetical protein